MSLLGEDVDSLLGGLRSGARSLLGMDGEVDPYAMAMLRSGGIMDLSWSPYPRSFFDRLTSGLSNYGTAYAGELDRRDEAELRESRRALAEAEASRLNQFNEMFGSSVGGGAGTSGGPGSEPGGGMISTPLGEFTQDELNLIRMAGPEGAPGVIAQILDRRRQSASTERDLTESEFNMANTLRDDFRTQSQDAYTVLQFTQNGLNADPNNPIGIISIVYSYIKAIDPGSVVRESEITLSSPGVLRNFPLLQDLVTWWTSGQPGTIPPEQVAAIQSELRRLNQEYSQIYRQYEEQYNNMASQYGIPSDMVIMPAPINTSPSAMPSGFGADPNTFTPSTPSPTPNGSGGGSGLLPAFPDIGR